MMDITHSLILCKNNRSAKLLFERYCEMCYKAGEDFKVDRQYLSVKFGTGFIVRFISAIKFYNEVYRGNDAAIIIGDKEFDSRLDAMEEQLRKKEATNE